MKRTLATAVMMVLMWAGPAGAAPPAEGSAPAPLTQADLLHRLIDVERLMFPPAEEYSGMFSSYDRRARLDPTGATVTWAHEEDRGQFERAGEDGWMVMAEVDGPGIITRIWSPDPTGRLRFIFDRQNVLELDFTALFDGQTPPFGPPLCYVTAGAGHNCYFPLGFAQSCQVQCRASTSTYEISYVRLRRGTRVESFTPRLDDAARAALELVRTVLQDASSVMYSKRSQQQLMGEARTYPLSSFDELRDGERLVAETAAGGGVIRALHVALTDRSLPRTPYALRRCILRIYFDGAAQPAVEAPLMDFFGSGFDYEPFNSLLCGTNKWTTMPGHGTYDDPNKVTQESRFMYCHFPMPFRDTARIEIEANAGRRLGLSIWARVDSTPPPAEALRFHARFRREDPCKADHYVLLETSGPGRIVGCTFGVDCPRGDWWGAGDYKLWIDGVRFPTVFGTGADGLLGDGPGLAHFARPLHGVTRCGTFGKNAGYRWFISDCLNFEAAARLAIANLHVGEVRDTYYSSVVYWYAPAEAPGPGGTALFPGLTPELVMPPSLRVPGAVEVEGHVLGEGWGTILHERNADGNELSAGAAAIITTREPVQINIPAERTRPVHLTLRVHQLGTRFFRTIDIRDPAGAPLATLEFDPDSDGYYPVGAVTLQAGDNLFTVECPRNATLDCWVLEDLPPDDTTP